MPCYGDGFDTMSTLESNETLILAKTLSNTASDIDETVLVSRFEEIIRVDAFDSLVSHGEQGPQGIPGTKGDKGDKGDAGSSASLSTDPHNMTVLGGDGGIYTPDVVADPVAYYILAKS